MSSLAKRIFRRTWKQGRKRYVLLGLPLITCLWVTYLLTSRPHREAHDLPRDTNTGQMLFEVPVHATPQGLAKELHAKGLIAHPLTFRLFLRATGRDRQIKAGFFAVKPRNSVLEMSWLITDGKLATRTITIAEGKASWEIYGILKQRFGLDSLTFDSLANSAAFARELGLDAPGLEGYLFPDTYVLPWKISEKEVLRLMVKRFQAVVEQIHPHSPVTDRYGIHGWLTLASIVEKEAAVPSERKLIAGVFYNRLLENWSLGADPTVRYSVKKLTGRLTYSDLNVNSPYNTRRFAGLPPGPICNPGKGALLAALNPLQTDMMFFVAKDDGSRTHFFSRDNTEHVNYKGLAAENRRKSREAKMIQQVLMQASPAISDSSVADSSPARKH